MKEIILGPYLFCGGKIKVRLDPGMKSGSMSWPGLKEPESLPVVRVGIGNLLEKDGNWFTFTENVLHELLEGAFLNDGVSFIRSYGVSNTTDGRFFMMNHEQFSEAVARVSDMLPSFLKDAVKAVRAAKRKPKTKKKAKK